MQVGIKGLGRMGGNVAHRLLGRGHEAIAYDREPEAVEGLADDGAPPAARLEEFVRKLNMPRAISVISAMRKGFGGDAEPKALQP